MLLMSLFLACSGPANLEGIETETAEVQLVEQCATLQDRVICDFDAINSADEIALLSDLYGQPIVLDLSAGWCGPCKAAASNLQATADLLPGVTFLTVLIEDAFGDIPDGSDLEIWANNYSITTEPVWGASRDIISQNPIDMENHLFLSGWPTFYFIDSNGRLQEYIRGYDEATIIEKASALD